MSPREGRRELEEQLPFLLNGTLDADEAARLQSHLERSESAQEEAAFLGLLRTVVIEEADDEEMTSLEQRRALSRVRREMSASRTSRFLPYALAASLLLLAGQAAIVAVLLDPGRGAEFGRAGESGELSGGGRFEPAGAASRAALAVRFRETAREREIRALLLEQGLILVEGPSAAGVYGLGFADPGASEERVGAVLAALRAAEETVGYAGLR